MPSPARRAAPRMAAFSAGVTRIWSCPVLAELGTSPEYKGRQSFVNTYVLTLRRTQKRGGSRQYRGTPGLALSSRAPQVVSSLLPPTAACAIVALTMSGPPPDPGTEGASPPKSPERRSFLRLAWIGLGVAALGEAAWIVTSFLKPRRKAPESAVGLVVAGPAERFAPGSVTAFPAGKFYLVRLADGGFLALHRQCTHLGCSVPWDEAAGRFACPCHASVFDLRGAVLQPPAPRPLDLFPIRIENGIVKVDTTTPLRRSGFEPSQVTRI